jgi:flagellar hook assembly protein FlgD/phage anti-repressor protein
MADISATNMPSNINASLYIYNGSQGLIASQYSGGYGQDINLQLEIPVIGDYYVRIYDNSNNDSSLELYQLQVDFTVNPDIYEPNNNFANAADYTLGEAINPAIFPKGDQDYFKFTTTAAGILDISVTNIPSNINGYLRVYNGSQSQIAYKYSGGNGQDINLQTELPAAGDYYIYIYDASNDASSLDLYQLQVDFTGNPDIYEPNDDFASAADYPLGEAINPTIFPKGDQDYFKFTTTKAGIADISATNVPSNINASLYIYNSSQGLIASQYSGGYGQDINLQLELSSAGDYYIHIFDEANNASSVELYQLQVDFTANPDIYEPNDDFADAADYTIGEAINPAIFPRGDQDYFKFSVTATGIVDISVLNIAANINACMRVYNASQGQIAFQYSGGYGQDMTLSTRLPQAGEYYIHIYDDSNNASSPELYELHVDFTVNPDIYEPNDDFASAADYTLGETINPTIFPQGDQDYFKFSVTSAGMIDVSVTNIPADINAWLRIWNNSRGQVTFKYSGGWGQDIRLSIELPQAGEYYLHIYDDANNTASISPYQVQTGFYTLWLKNVSVLPDIFSPNNDGQKDIVTIKAESTALSDWTIEIKNSSNTTVRSFNGTSSLISEEWDGKDETGTVVADGIYTYYINATDGTNNAPEITATVEVDTKIDQAIISNITSGQSLSDVVDVSGIADDINYYYLDSYLPDYYHAGVYYGQGISPTSWQLIGSQLSLPVKPDIDDNPQLLCSWDTTMLPNGDYVIRLVVNDKAGNQQFRHVPVILYNVNIYNVSDSPDPFSPNGDGEKDTVAIKADFTALSDWTIEIKNSSNTTVRSFNGTSFLISEEWDGKDETGTVVADGIYTYYINATAGTSQTTEVSGTVEVDTQIDSAVISNITSGQSLSGMVDVTGIADDINYYYVDSYLPDYYHGGLYYGEGSSPTDWFMLGDYLRSPVKPDSEGNPRVLRSWDTAVLSNGNYVLRLVVNDETANQQIVDIPVEIYNEGPDIDNLTVTPNPFSPDESGTWIDPDTGEVFNDPGPGLILDDIAEIFFTATAPAFFNIAVFDSGQNLVKQLVYGSLTPEPATNLISLQWDGRDQNNDFVPNGEYTLIVNAGSVGKQKTAQVWVDKKPFITNAVVSPNPFSPDGDGVDEETVISYDISEISYVSVELYNQPGTLVKTLVDHQLFAKGNYSHNWDGTDEQGTVLPDGKYTVKISAQAETGNMADPVYLNVSVLFISNIKISDDEINPYLGETTSINYQMARDGILSIKIYNSDDTLIRTLISTQARSTGSHSESWDGKDDSNQIVADGAYYLVIEDSISGSPAVVYNPQGTGGKDISGSISFSTTDFDPLLNQFCVLNYTLPQVASINLKVRHGRYAGPTIRVIKYEEPTSSGSHQTAWDGRDEAGNFVKYSPQYLCALWGYSLDENSVVVVGGRPELSNLAISPIRFSPYVNPYSLINSSQSTISFDLSMAANVTINIYDQDSNLVRTLLDAQACSQGANSFIWDGKSNNGKPVPDGFYRVVIQAEKAGNYSQAYTLHSEIFY